MGCVWKVVRREVFDHIFSLANPPGTQHLQRFCHSASNYINPCDDFEAPSNQAVSNGHPTKYSVTKLTS